MFATFICAHCGAQAMQSRSAVNRARKRGAPIYCGRACAGLARRRYKSTATRKAEKQQYDAMRRIILAPQIKAAKALRHKRTYDPVKAAIERKRRAPAHAEYCRRPEYRAWKQGYDNRRRAEKQFGEFAEAALALQALKKEVLSRSSRYELDLQNGRLCKAKQRRREYERLNSFDIEDGALGNLE